MSSIGASRAGVFVVVFKDSQVVQMCIQAETHPSEGPVVMDLAGQSFNANSSSPCGSLVRLTHWPLWPPPCSGCVHSWNPSAQEAGVIMVHKLLCPYRDVLHYLYTKDSIAVHVGCSILVRDWRVLHGFKQQVCSCDAFLLLPFGGPLHPAVCLPEVLFGLCPPGFPLGSSRGKLNSREEGGRRVRLGNLSPCLTSYFLGAFSTWAFPFRSLQSLPPLVPLSPFFTLTYSS